MLCFLLVIQLKKQFVDRTLHFLVIHILSTIHKKRQFFFIKKKHVNEDKTCKLNILLEIGFVSRKSQERVDVLILCLNINNPGENILSTVHWFGAAMWNGLKANTTHDFVIFFFWS